MKALILAAGYATRLYPLTRIFPKSLLEVGGRPIADHIIGKLNAVRDIDEIIVVTNARFFAQFRRWKKTVSASTRVTILNDLTTDNETRLGAIGDMNFAVRRLGIKEDLIVIGGDNIFDGDMADFAAFARRHPRSPVMGVFDIRSRREACRYGVVEVNSRGRVVNFQEKPDQPRSALVGMCLYYFPQQRLSLIREYLDRKNRTRDAMGFYIDWLRKKTAVYAYVFRGRWYDIGDHKYYREAQREFRIDPRSKVEGSPST